MSIFLGCRRIFKSVSSSAASWIFILLGLLRRIKSVCLWKKLCMIKILSMLDVIVL